MSKSAAKAARRLWRSFRLPADAGRILSDPRYHTAAFCRLYLEGCGEWLAASPAEALVAARIAPPLVLKLAPSGARHDLQVWALALLGSAYRENGNLFAAASTFPLAFEVEGREKISPEIAGDLCRRYSVLLADQGRFAESAAMLRRAADAFETLPPGKGDFSLGAVLLQRGELRLRQHSFAEAIDDFGMALAQLDPKRNARPYLAAARNLAAALDLAPELGFVNQATRWLRFARGQQKGRRSSLARFELYCIEAEVLAKVGSTRRAQKNLQIARKGFERLGACPQLALAALQLGFLLHGEGRFEELRRLAAETVTSCRAIGAGGELLALLEAWSAAAAAGVPSRAQLASFERLLRESVARAGRPAPFGEPFGEPFGVPPRM